MTIQKIIQKLAGFFPIQRDYVVNAIVKSFCGNHIFSEIIPDRIPKQVIHYAVQLISPEHSAAISPGLS